MNNFVLLFTLFHVLLHFRYIDNVVPRVRESIAVYFEKTNRPLVLQYIPTDFTCYFTGKGDEWWNQTGKAVSQNKFLDLAINE